MRKLALLIAVVLMLAGTARAQTVVDAPQIVQSVFTCSAQVPSSSVTTCTYGSDASSTSDLDIVFAATNSTTVTGTISSNHGTCTLLDTTPTGTNPRMVAYSCTITSTASAIIITDTLSAGNAATSFIMYEISGQGTLDQKNAI